MKYIRKIEDIKDYYLSSLLESKGIMDMSRFFNPSKADELDACLLDNIDGAAEIVLSNLYKKIALLIDPDCDGFTSAAIICQYLMELNPNIDITFFFHSAKQHGLQDMEEIKNGGFNLVIIPDASSNDYEYHKELLSCGSEIVILDHHEADGYSDYACVVNNQLASKYENKFLSGAGVTYKFCEYLDKLLGKDFSGKYIDLAAIGIIGDMMSLTSCENRYIVSEGLKNITNPFLQEIVQRQAYSIGDTEHLSPINVSFYIAPLINALIRVGKDSEKEIMFKALINGNEMVQSTKRGAKPGVFESLAMQAVRTCVNAHSRQNRAKEKALDQLEMKICKNGLDMHKIIVVEVEDEDIDTTLTGLIAMQIVAKYHKPALVVRRSSDGYLRGSARGMNKSELNDLRRFEIDSGYFEYAEGHKNAHGVSIHESKLESYLEYADRELKDINFNEGVYEVDFIRESEDLDITDIIYDLTSHPEIWGNDLEEPLIVVENILISKSNIQIIGEKKNTLKFDLNGITCLKFKAEDLIEQLKNIDDIRMTILCTANLNDYYGNVTPQLFIKDYNIYNSLLDF